jgi:GAF domain-containing protein
MFIAPVNSEPMAAIAEPTHIESRPQSATTLGTVVELVRRITHADVISIVSFSLAEKTMSWLAASGFHAHTVDEAHPLARPLTNRIEMRALTATDVLVIDGIGENAEFPAENFPVHAAEGVRDLAVATLRARRETLGALLVGYRTHHEFSDDEKRLLQDLADLAAVTLDNARLSNSIGEAESIWKQTFDAIHEGILVQRRGADHALQHSRG